jgi:hypothetical protein
MMSSLPRTDQVTPGRRLELVTKPPPDALRPLTERILTRLPGRRPLWFVLWATVPFVYLALPATFDLSRSDVGGTSPEALVAAVYAYVIALSLWGARKMARDAAAVGRQLTWLYTGQRAFRKIDNVAVPLALTLAASAVGAIAGAVALGSWIGLLLFPLYFLVNLPLMTAVWTYLAVLIGLDRLGRGKLDLDDAFPADPVLGLGPVGSLAFTAFLIFVTGFVPVLVVSFVNPIFLIVDLVLLVPGVVLFFMSLYRLHRQMSETRSRHVQRARGLYMRANAAVWESDDLEVWRRESSLLRAVSEIERRATSISTWPFSSSVSATILAISVGLSVTLVGRVITFVVGL